MRKKSNRDSNQDRSAPHFPRNLVAATRKTAVLTALATTTMLATANNALAYPAPNCTSPVGSPHNVRCGFGDSDIVITKDGSITVTDGAALEIYPAYTSSLLNNGTLTADGSYTHLYGIYTYDNVNGTGSITNNGAIDVTYSALYAGNTIAGLYGNGDVNGLADNNGTIDVSATAGGSIGSHLYAYGIYANGDVGGSIMNNGTIGINLHRYLSTVNAYGIYVGEEVGGAITNNGTIDITGTLSNAEFHADGIHVNGDVNGVITNNGAINIAAAGTDSGVNFTADGIYVGGALNDSIINNGALSITSHDGSGTQNIIGINVNDGMTTNASITNNGTISISTNGDSINSKTNLMIGIAVSGAMQDGASITNNGTIDVTSYLRGALAAPIGIYVAGDISGAGASITNNGTINVNMFNNQEIGVAGGIFAGSVSGNGANITNNGTITVRGSGDETFSFVIGLGADNLGANSSIVNTGTVTVSNLLYPVLGFSIFVENGAGTVYNSGILTGNILMNGTGALINSGTIALPSETTYETYAQVRGNYTQAAGGVLGFGVASNDAYAKMAIAGTANFSGSSKLAVNLEPGNTYEGGPLTDVIKVDGILTHPTSFTVTDNSLAYDFSPTVIPGSPNYVTLNAAPTGLTTFTAAVETTGNRSGLGAAGALDYLLTNGSTATISELSNMISGIATNQQASNLVSQTLPLLAGSTEQVIMDTTHNTNRIIQARLDSDSGFSSGEGFTGDRYVWLKPFGSWANQDDRNGASGYSASTGGMALGGDTMVSGRARLGAAVVYSYTDVDSNSAAAPQSDHINTYQGVAYGSYSLNGRTDLDFQADLGNNANEGKRTIALAGQDAFSNYDSWSEHAGAGLEQKYNLDQKTVFIPSLRADYTHVSSQGYAESGAGPLDLDVNGNSKQELIVGLDGKVSRPVTDYLTLSANAGVGYDTLSERASITSNFVGGGGAFVTQGINPSPWLGRAGVGAVLNQFHGVEVTARYDLEARTGFTDQTASLKLRMPF